ncbi:BQ5605_C008g05184 [Microbotryum silenes-dioicae]|uniref:BQ5605_C008g05184 protein n=1 Tax=Microbotryum silenes-dioicae TaxID=796604 RepID=A0A2X0P7Y1_9BASI|nr:BQ5605_C008g05184 [Microbotryum silenes-dioicae]
MPLFPASSALAWKAGALLSKSTSRSIDTPHPRRASKNPSSQGTDHPIGSVETSGSTGIMAGAFGAHALAPRLGEKTATWTMASHYAIVNGVALLAISQHPIYSKRWSAPLIIVGTTLFSGSIFALLLYREKMGALTKIVGPATPLGGLLMIGGYLSLVGPCALHLTPD